MEEKNNPEATIEMEDGEKIVIELFPEKAPNTVNNFISLATSGFYDGLIFHRVISGFMIQGGDPFGEGTGGPNYSIKGEFANNGYTNNNVSHTRGVISMARTNEMDSAGSQFFIMHADGDFLNGDYAAFGIVKSGIEEVDKIASVEKDANDKPLVEQKIKTITIDTKGVTYPEPETIKR
ncbi:MAG: peptidylprolyl isomerase [Eubacteriales bacterium]|nr:peptidylprolyl isomerase [Eubacteriales bacterium]